MIKLLIAANIGGRLIPAGTVRGTFGAEMDKNLLAAGNAELVDVSGGRRVGELGEGVGESEAQTETEKSEETAEAETQGEAPQKPVRTKIGRRGKSAET